MKKYILKINTFLFSFMLTVPTLLVYADSDEELVIRNISNAILSIVSWFAYAIALGALMFFGIKYMMSGANEKANLKGMLPKYLIGIALIVMCFGIASAIAEIAGNDDAQSIIDVGKEAGDHFAGGIKDDSSTSIFEGSYATGGTADNPYMDVEKIYNEDGTYTEIVSGSNRNDGIIETTYTKDGKVIEKKKLNKDGTMVSNTTYDENGVYNKKMYDNEYISANDYIYGEVMDALRTQDNGYMLTTNYVDTNGDGLNDKVIYTDILGNEKGDGEIFYDEQGRVTRIFRNEYDNGKDKGYTEHVYMDIKYNDNGFSVENIDALAWMNSQQYKFDVITNKSGSVGSVTYYEYVSKFGIGNDEYVKQGTTQYNVNRPRN